MLRAHAAGIAVYGGTLTSFVGSLYYRPKPIAEADREAINRWILEPGHFDDAIDFDAAMRDPRRPERLRPDVDSGDHLHPSPAGYRVMAESVSLSLFRHQPLKSAVPGKAAATVGRWSDMRTSRLEAFSDGVIAMERTWT